ncbi:hypothetical protein HORIV_64910 [Vreelandella olivaria]|uniref:Uncharacterized protein n=1 Tax=Vreelandella olivaria TaxID=390919 RepID=A0ABN5X4L6_9GAMM|nr:hypothetical protein HORIV_64910 [Halomonas olivaria]
MEAAGDIGAVDERHRIGIQAEVPVAETFAHIAIKQGYGHSDSCVDAVGVFDWLALIVVHHQYMNMACPVPIVFGDTNYRVLLSYCYLLEKG